MRKYENNGIILKIVCSDKPMCLTMIQLNRNLTYNNIAKRSLERSEKFNKITIKQNDKTGRTIIISK